MIGPESDLFLDVRKYIAQYDLYFAGKSEKK